ncbi:unannotated protein [freshwater metagenome]|uniref:sulfate adenylyltransferase n=1 Tax=freshwater metagenome TaxID=449393 RepID=A0A6J6DX10_9ZZZZ|nr:sulfate adenylyltransferase [Actinomycetota bacterium]
MVLRIATAGSVDDGKSTLIGRLLHDTKTVFEDQLASVEKASLRYGDGSLNLALLTDGLRAEREQGITIDVAYRYFATPRRTFVVADTPGHAQYTRNMVTGASVSDVAIVLVDARNGLTEQTRRHLFVASLLGVKQVMLAVNKMDLVDFSRDRYDEIVAAATAHATALPAPVTLNPLPISALLGDNVVDPSDNMPWFTGRPLLEQLETLELDDDQNIGARLSVQWVIRPYSTEHHDYRGLAGRLTGGTLAIGDRVRVLPGAQQSTIVGIDRGGVPQETAEPGEAVSIQLADDIDVSRGDVLVTVAAPKPPVVADQIVADVSWMVDKPLEVGSRWIIKHLTRTAKAFVSAIETRHDVVTAAQHSTERLELNDLGRVHLNVSVPLVVDLYDDHRPGGAAILVDEATGMTCAALMIRGFDGIDA